MKISMAKWAVALAALSTVAVAVGGVAESASDTSDANAEWTDKRPPLTTDSTKFGVYDPHADFSQKSLVGIEHLYLPWEDVDLSSLNDADEYARERGRTLLVTVEPWSWGDGKSVGPEELYSGIVGGVYDPNIKAVCSKLAEMTSPLTVRWAQEMEDREGRFPWAKWTPAQYRTAYRHFINLCRAELPNAKWMWSPKCLDSLKHYYPGDDVVDEVGLSLFGLQSYDIEKYGRPRRFEESLAVCYDRAAPFRKPIVVAELGYEGDAEYVADWAESAAGSLPQFPMLAALVYFNDREVNPWPDGFGLPYWRVTKDGAD